MCWCALTFISPHPPYCSVHATPSLQGFRNLEEYANTGTVGPDRELPFAVQFCTPGWHPLIRDTFLVELRQYFCRVDGEGALLMTKDQFYKFFFTDKGRKLLARDLKNNVKGLSPVRSRSVCKPFECITKRFQEIAEPAHFNRTFGAGDGEGASEDDGEDGGEGDGASDAQHTRKDEGDVKAAKGGDAEEEEEEEDDEDDEDDEKEDSDSD